MALFKVLKGQEANLPTEKKEGWAYVTFVDETIPVGQQYGEGSMYVDIDKNNRIKINMHADMASMDDQHQSIVKTYIKDIALKNSATAPYYELKYGDNTVSNETHTLLPIASATNAGILTADTKNVQVLTGPKKIDTNGSLEISKTGGFNYSGIDLGTANQNRTIWFSDSGFKGKPVTNSKFIYNPASTDPWDGYKFEVTGTAATAHGVLTAERLQGIAYQAFLDTNKIKITSYLQNIELVNHATQPYYTLVDGDGMKDKTVNLPVADASNAGIITTATQDFSGSKAFLNGVIIKSGLSVYYDFDYKDIQQMGWDPTNGADTPIWFSHPANKGNPVYDEKFTYNGSCLEAWSADELETSVDHEYSVINVDRLNGLAKAAVTDSDHNNITNYYIHNINQNPTVYQGRQLHYPYTMGNHMSNNTFIIDSADLTNPGLLSATGTQYLTGQKIFVSEEDVGTWGSDFDEIMLMEYGAYYTNQGDLPDGQISIFSDSHTPLQLTSTTQPGLIIKNSAGKVNNNPPIITDNSILVENLNVDLLDGFHASNATFEWSTADAASEQVIPTRSAICRSLNNLLQASQALYYKGTIDPTNSSSIPSSAKVGDVYIFLKAGTCFSQNVEAGDMAICSAVNGNTITWNIIQMNIDGAVRSSTNSSTNGELVLFDGTSGKAVKNSDINTTITSNNTFIYKQSGNLSLGFYTPQIRRPLNIVYATKIIGGTYSGEAALSGAPTAPTAAEGTNTTQIATTAFVKTAINTAVTGVKSDVADICVLKSGDTMTGELIVPKIQLSDDLDSGSPAVTNMFTRIHLLPSPYASTIANLAQGFIEPMGTNNIPVIFSQDTEGAYSSGENTWNAYVFSPFNGLQIYSEYASDGNNTVIGYVNETSGNMWTINDAGYFSGAAQQVDITNDTTSKIYVLGATTTGAAYVYRESSVYMQNNVLYGAAWNDYAEFRQGDTLEPGKCVIEAGDDTLTLATGRMIPGASIVSDTFGFSIGETEKCKTPIAVSGRVLAYPYESREEFKKNIGRPVCSGPNGTVSIMTDEEYREKGYCALGTISAVPDYEEWGTGNVKVNNRVWIHVK